MCGRGRAKVFTHQQICLFSLFLQHSHRRRSLISLVKAPTAELQSCISAAFSSQQKMGSGLQRRREQAASSTATSDTVCAGLRPTQRPQSSSSSISGGYAGRDKATGSQAFMDLNVSLCLWTFTGNHGDT